MQSSEQRKKVSLFMHQRGSKMSAFIPVACTVATVLVCILAYRTGKGTLRTIERKKRKNVRNTRS